MKKSKYITLAAILSFVMLPLMPSQARKVIDDKKIVWEKHKSITNVFDVKFPKKYKYKIFPFQFNKDTIAYSETIIGSLDDGKEINKGKSAMIRVTQTFGSSLISADINLIFDKEVKKHRESAKDIKGHLTAGVNIYQKGFRGKEYYISYLKNGERYGMRIRVYTTNYAKIEQILSGPASGLYSYKSEDYFNSLNLYDHRVQTDSPVGVGWIKYPSRNNTFTLTLPPKNSDYTPYLPKSSSTPYTEQMQFSIKDPLLGEQVQYKVHSYRALSNFTHQKAKSILYSKHVSKYLVNANLKRLKAHGKAYKDYKSIETDIKIKPTKKHPDVSAVFFKAVYKNKTLVIQEILYGYKYAKSGIHETLFSLFEFHPEKYKYINKRTKK